jgi:hypothetical protein
MRLDFCSNKNFWAGLMFIGIGAAAMYIASGYRFGTTRQMGPGYFPTALSGALVLFGIYIMVKGLCRVEKINGSMSAKAWRALIVLPISLVLFGLLMKYAGLVPALMTLGFGSAIAGSQFKWKEALALSAFLTLLMVAMFIWGLGLHYHLISGF